MITIYHNPRCRKSREALALLEQNTDNIEVIEYLKETPSKEELSRVVDLLGIKPQELIRKGESIFKENFKGKDLTDEGWIEAMVAFPKLIERPIAIHGHNAVVGRPPENVLKIL